MRIGDLLMHLCCLSPFRYRAKKCGDMTKRTGRIYAFGKSTTMKMPMNDRDSVDWCLDCVAKMTIQCAWCKLPIFIGNPITLYVATGGIGDRAHAVVWTQNPLRLVGCMDCADTLTDQGGFWLPDEKGNGSVCVQKTIYEMFLVSKP